MIPQFPKLKLPLDAKTIDALNVTLSQLRDLLTGRVAFNENTLNHTMDIEFTAGTTPWKQTTLSERPLGVIPIAFDLISGGTPGYAAMASPLSWRYDAGRLYFPSLSGIAGTSTYRLRVLIVRG